ncbi:uncharacterized protein LOC123406535 [Hordeum vulgare subsp. vulgare]|uniref:uncharacterized protein LOC123406535 n=1 Tax=Hordeum vulgare subsp. vulgare TaxID=112509 RepID=UPI000B47AA83|nr:uncharacterized protein LOC123406535 [Hordeum vulgare subsp. vulgare]
MCGVTATSLTIQAKETYDMAGGSTDAATKEMEALNVGQTKETNYILKNVSDSNGGATGGAQSSPPVDDDDAQVDGPSEDGAGAPAAAKKKKKKSKATSAARPFYASPAINAVQMIMFGSEMPLKAATAERIPPPRFRYMVMRTL